MTITDIQSPPPTEVRNWRQPRFSGLKILEPTLQVTTSATRTAARAPAQQVSRNLERLNEKITRPPSLSPPLLEDDLDCWKRGLVGKIAVEKITT